MKCGMVDKIVI